MNSTVAANAAITSIPMSGPDITQAEIDAVLAVLSTGCLSLGPCLDAFEHRVAARVGARNAIAVSSGTAGLHLAVIAAGVGDGDLVITTPFSFVASANCVLYERALPVFVDVDPRTGNIDVEQVAAAAHDLRRGGAARDRWLPPALRGRPGGAALKAILPVHAFGHPADMDPLLDVAAAHGLTVIEDACEAVGSTYRGRAAGHIGDIGVFAFYPNKQATTGEGGVIVTDRDDYAALCRSLRNQGRDAMNVWLAHDRLGYNYRMDEMRAALGSVQFDRLDELVARRARVTQWYGERLRGMTELDLPSVTTDVDTMSWFAFVVRLAPWIDRHAFMRALDGWGVPTRPYFSPIHLQPFYVERFGYRRGDFPVTERLGDRSLALPFSSTMTEAAVDRICRALQEACLAPGVSRRKPS